MKLLFKQSFLQVVQNIQHKKQQQSVLRLCLHLHALQAELILPKVLPRADESHTWEMLSLWRRKLSLSLSKIKVALNFSLHSLQTHLWRFLLLCSEEFSSEH